VKKQPQDADRAKAFAPHQILGPAISEAARMLVEVVHPEKSTGMIRLQLPGQTMPYTDAPIFAQTSGYLKKWYFDIGTTRLPYRLICLSLA